MAQKMSKAEAAFRAKYPHARTTEEKSVRTGLTLVTVYAGDYLCADGFGRAEAFKKAAEWAEAGLITPDPEEAHAPYGGCKHTYRTYTLGNTYCADCKVWLHAGLPER